MKCEDFGKYLDNYENLSDHEKTEMTDHAAMCEKCREELDFFLAMLAAAKSLPPIEPPADFMETLNARLDAEDKKVSPSRIARHVRRNWKQYTSLAACLALVAVITANRGILLDRIEGSEDGVITEETVENGDNAAPIGTAEETTVAQAVTEPEAAPAQTAGEQPAAPVTVAKAAPSGTSAPAQRNQNRVSETAVNTQTTNTAPSETAVDIGTDAENNASAPAVTSPLPEKKSGDYGIALKGAIQSVTETASVNYDLTIEEVSASLRAIRVIDNYSLADGTESIALGRYYSIDANGKPIMTTDNSAPKAIGSLKISADDAEKAMDVLNQYPHDENGNVYTTGSENVERILSDLSDEGVTYTDYIAGGSDNVKFRIEFN